jgi:hypothetical protein
MDICKGLCRRQRLGISNMDRRYPPGFGHKNIKIG